MAAGPDITIEVSAKMGPRAVNTRYIVETCGSIPRSRRRFVAHDGDFLTNEAAGVEAWAYVYDPGSKKQSMKRCYSGSSPKYNENTTIIAAWKSQAATAMSFVMHVLLQNGSSRKPSER